METSRGLTDKASTSIPQMYGKPSQHLRSGLRVEKKKHERYPSISN